MVGVNANRGLIRKVAIALFLVAVVAFFCERAYRHAVFFSEPDQSTWWNPFTWSSGPAHSLDLLGSDLLAATSLLPVPSSPLESEAVERLRAVLSTSARRAQLDKVASGELELAELPPEVRGGYEEARSALVALVEAGGTALPLRKSAASVAAIHLDELRQDPVAAASWCVGALRLASRQLESPGYGVSLRLANGLGSRCTEVLAGQQPEGVAGEIGELLGVLPTGRLGTHA